MPALKSIPLNVQLQSTEKIRSSEEESVSSIDSEFSTIKEKRDDMIDPLLGVLHTSQQTRARLSEAKDLQVMILVSFVIYSFSFALLEEGNVILSLDLM